jgi:ferredoxin-type protein NapH
MKRSKPPKPDFFTRHRTWIMLLSLLLFMPPLSLLFQLTADSGFCGTWCPRMFYVWRHGSSIGAYVAGFSRSYMGVILVFGVLAWTVFRGRYWCSHLCPVGGCMELVGRLVPRSLKINFSAIPAPAFRYGYLSVYFLAAALGIGSLCCSYCNFAAVPRMFGAAFSPADLAYFLRTAGLVNLGLVVVLGFLSRGGRAYCNLICPLGALDSLVNGLTRSLGKKYSVSADKCDGCGACKNACPVWAIEITTKARIDPFSCIPCAACLTACPRGAVDYGNPKPLVLQPLDSPGSIEPRGPGLRSGR